MGNSRDSKNSRPSFLERRRQTVDSPPKKAKDESVVTMAKKLRLFAHLAFARQDTATFTNTDSSLEVKNNNYSAYAKRLTDWIKQDIVDDPTRIEFWFNVMNQSHETLDSFTANCILNALMSPPITILLSDGLKKNVFSLQKTIVAGIQTDSMDYLPDHHALFKDAQLIKEINEKYEKKEEKDKKDKKKPEIQIRGIEKEAIEKYQKNIERNLTLQEGQLKRYNALCHELDLPPPIKDLTEEFKKVDNFFMDGALSAASEMTDDALLKKAKEKVKGLRISVYHWPNENSGYGHSSIEVEDLKTGKKEYISWGDSQNDIRRDIQKHAMDPSVLTRVIKDADFSVFMSQYGDSRYKYQYTPKYGSYKSTYNVFTENCVHAVQNVMGMVVQSKGTTGIDVKEEPLVLPKNYFAPGGQVISPKGLYDELKKQTLWRPDKDRLNTTQYWEEVITSYFYWPESREKITNYILEKLQSEKDANLLLDRFASKIASKMHKEVSIIDLEGFREDVTAVQKLFHKVKSKFPHARLSEDVLKQLKPFVSDEDPIRVESAGIVLSAAGQSETTDDKSVQAILLSQLKDKQETAIQSMIEFARCQSLQKQFNFLQAIVKLTKTPSAYKFPDFSSKEYTDYLAQQKQIDHYLEERFKLRDEIVQLNKEFSDKSGPGISQKIKAANLSLEHLNKKFKNEFKDKKFPGIEAALNELYTQLAKDTIDSSKRAECLFIINELFRSLDHHSLLSDRSPVTTQSQMPSSIEFADKVRDTLKIKDCQFMTPEIGDKNDPGLYGGTYMVPFKDPKGQLHPKLMLIKQATDNKGVPNHRENMAEGFAAACMANIMGRGMYDKQIAGTAYVTLNDEVKKNEGPNAIYSASIDHPHFISLHEAGIRRYNELKKIKTTDIPARPLGAFDLKNSVSQHYYTGLIDILSADSKHEHPEDAARLRESLGRTLSASLLFGNYKIHPENVGLATVVDEKGHPRKEFVIRDFSDALRSMLGREKGGFSKGIHPNSADNYLLFYPKSIRESKEFISGLDYIVAEKNEHLIDSIHQNIDELVRVYGAEAVVKHLGVYLDAKKNKILEIKGEADQITYIKDTLSHTIIARKFSLRKMSLKSKINNSLNSKETKRDYSFEQLVKQNPVYFTMSDIGDRNQAAQRILNEVMLKDPENLEEEFEHKLFFLIRQVHGNLTHLSNLTNEIINLLNAFQSAFPNPKLDEIRNFLLREQALGQPLKKDDFDTLIQACDQAYGEMRHLFKRLKDNEKRNILVAIDAPVNSAIMMNARALQNKLQAISTAEFKPIAPGSFTEIKAIDILNYIQGRLAKDHKLTEKELELLTTISADLMKGKGSLISAINNLSKLPGLEKIKEDLAEGVIYIGPKPGGARKPGQFGALYKKVSTGKTYLLKKDTEERHRIVKWIAKITGKPEPKSKEHNDKDICELVASELTNLMFPGLAPNYIVEKHPKEDTPYIGSEFFDKYKGLYVDITHTFYQLPVVENLLDQIKITHPLTKEDFDKLIDKAEEAAKEAVGDINNPDACTFRFKPLLNQLRQLPEKEYGKISDILKTYIKENKARFSDRTYFKIIKLGGRPFFLGTHQVLGTKKGRRFKYAMLHRKQSGEYRYQDIEKALIASLFVADFDTHSENMGVVSEPDGTKRIKRIDYGAALAKKHFKNKKDVEMQSASLLLHAPGFEPTNHIKEYPRAIKISKVFADNIHTAITAMRDLSTNHKKLDDILKKVELWPLESIQKFAKYIGISEKDVAEFHDKEDLITFGIKPHILKTFAERCVVMEKLELEIRISLCFDSNGILPAKKSNLKKLILDNVDYFTKGNFQFYGKDQVLASVRLAPLLKAEVNRVLGDETILKKPGQDQKLEEKLLDHSLEVSTEEKHSDAVTKEELSLEKDTLGYILQNQLRSDNPEMRRSALATIMQISQEMDIKNEASRNKQRLFFISMLQLVAPDSPLIQRLIIVEPGTYKDLVKECVQFLAAIPALTQEEVDQVMQFTAKLCRTPQAYQGHFLNASVVTIDKNYNEIGMVDLQNAFKQGTRIDECLYVSPKSGGANKPGPRGGNYLKSFKTPDGKIHLQKIFFKQATDYGVPNHRENIAEVKAGLGMTDIVDDNAAGVICAMYDRVPGAKPADPNEVYVGSIFLNDYQSAHESAFLAAGYDKKDIPKRKKGVKIYTDETFKNAFQTLVDAKQNAEQSHRYLSSFGRAIGSSLLYGNYQFHTENIGPVSVNRNGEKVREFGILDYGGAGRRRFAFKKELKGKFGKMVRPYSRASRKLFANYIESYPEKVLLSKGFLEGVDHVASVDFSIIKKSVEENTNYVIQFYGKKAFIDNYAKHLDTTGRTLKLTGNEDKDVAAIKAFEYQRLLARKFSLQKFSIKSKLKSPEFKEVDLIKDHLLYFYMKKNKQYRQYCAANQAQFTPLQRALLSIIESNKNTSKGLQRLVSQLNMQLSRMIETLKNYNISGLDLNKLIEMNDYFKYALTSGEYDLSKKSDYDILIQACDQAFREINHTVNALALPDQEKLIEKMYEGIEGLALLPKESKAEVEVKEVSLPKPKIYRTAQLVLKAINQFKLADPDALQKNQAAWKKTFETFDLKSFPDKDDHLDDYLATLRTDQLGSKSLLIGIGQEGQQRIRVYPRKPNSIDFKVDDFFGSGIDMSRAALAIIDYSTIKDSAGATNALKQALVDLQKDLIAIRNGSLSEMEKLEQAKKRSHQFNNELVNILVESGCYKEKDRALEGLAQARNMIWIISRQEEAICTVRGAIGSEIRELSYAERIKFDLSDSQLDHESQAWFTSLKTNHPWVDGFYKTYSNLLTFSPSSTQRDRPTPANAWDESTIFVDDNQVTHVISGARLGTTSPYLIKDEKERQQLTTQNHQLMLSNERLKSIVTHHLYEWQGLIPDNKITIPLLHQTLLDPGALRYYFSGDNPEDMVKMMSIANDQLREQLAGKSVFYDPIQHMTVISDDAEAQIPAGYIQIKFKLYDINNGINTWESVTTEKKSDVDNSRALISHVVDKLKLFQNDLVENAALKEVIEFLESKYVDNTYYLNKYEKERRAMEKLCSNLFHGRFPNIPKETQKNLALSVEAAFNLKIIHQETILSKTRREAMDVVDKKGGNLLGNFARGLISIFRLPARGVGRLADSIKNQEFILKNYRNTYKSCYERIIGESLGFRMGGCKSAVDREGEIAELTHGMYRSFHQTGKIIGWTDLAGRKEYLKKHVDTQHKHNMSEATTGTPGTIDIETQGEAYNHESESDMLKSKIASDLRKPVKEASPSLEAKAAQHVSPPKRTAALLIEDIELKSVSDKTTPAKVAEEAYDVSSPKDEKTPAIKHLTQTKQITETMHATQLLYDPEVTVTNLQNSAIPPTITQNKELKSSVETYKPDSLYQVKGGQASGGVFADKQTPSQYLLFSLKPPDLNDSSALLAYAHKQLQTFVGKKGYKTTIHLRKTMDERLANAFRTIANLNELKIVPKGVSAIPPGTPSEYRNLNPELNARIEKEIKAACAKGLEELEPFKSWMGKTQNDIITATNILSEHTISISNYMEYLQKIKSIHDSLTQDKNLCQTIIDKLNKERSLLTPEQQNYFDKASKEALDTAHNILNNIDTVLRNVSEKGGHIFKKFNKSGDDVTRNESPDSAQRRSQTMLLTNK